MRKAFISGCAGVIFSADEEVFFRTHRPWGLILFRRNIENPSQVRALIDRFRSLVNAENAPVFVDQEGGRVQRFGPPHWGTYPSAHTFGERFFISPLEALREARLCAEHMARELKEMGVTVSCLPVLDIPSIGEEGVIGDRAYGTDPQVVAILAGAVMDGLRRGGVCPVLKHIPGHGRAGVDSHHALPVVDAPRALLERRDFLPFAIHAEAPMAMTAHVLYRDLDQDHCATFSPKVISLIRDLIGFKGLLLSDDLSMGALSGSLLERTGRALQAGCDIVLHCNGALEEMVQVAEGAGILAGDGLERAENALEI